MIRLTNQARQLRNNLTDPEKYLWYILKSNQMGVKFRRQAPVGKYIVDFVCFKKKLIIELDGGQHAEQTNADRIRDEWLKGEGYITLRFWNNDVMENREGVVVKIQEYL